MLTDYIKAIKKCALFEGIEGEELKKILHCLQYRIVEYKKNDYAAIFDNKLDDVGIVLDGEAAVVKESISGNRTRVNIFHPGEMFGEVISLCGEEKWPASVQALSDCTIMYIHPEKILDFCENICSQHKVLLANLVRIVSRKANILNRKVEYLSIKSISGKLSKYLMEQYILQGKSTITIPLNREELAEFLNISRPSMSRELCKMRDNGIIEFYKESIKINDLEKLEALLEN